MLIKYLKTVKFSDPWYEKKADYPKAFVTEKVFWITMNF